MHDVVLNFLIARLLDASWWQIVVFTLVMTHITIAAVTIFLHRTQAHRALDLHPLVSHFFRLWLWLTTGMVTKEWVAIHRKHHAKCETVDDPHSPQVKGIKPVLLEGSELYRAEAKKAETLERYGHNTPDDWIEHHLYSRYTKAGIGLMFIVDVILFGSIGVTVWAVQMLWIPVTAAGIINGLGHYSGYRNFEPEDASTNILPWGILIGGEELHNNHHTYPTSAKLSVRSWEFDIGWVYIRAMELVGWAKVKKTPPKVALNWARWGLFLKDPQHLEVLRYEVVARLVQIKRQCVDDRLSVRAELLQEQFEGIWKNQSLQSSELLQVLQRWCDEARRSMVPELQRLAFELPCWEARRR